MKMEGNDSTFPPVLCSIPADMIIKEKGSQKQVNTAVSSGFVLTRSGKMLVSVKNISKAANRIKFDLDTA